MKKQIKIQHSTSSDFLVNGGKKLHGIIKTNFSKNGSVGLLCASLLNKGTVIPALPLALNSNRKLDERRQRALIRYYLDAGAGGIAVGVHTTQFAIRLPEIGLLNPLFELAAEEFNRFTANTKKAMI